MQPIASLFVRLGADTAQFRRSVKGAERQLHGSAKRMGGVASGLSMRLKMLFAGMAIGVVASFKKMISASIEFNASMANVATLIPGNIKRVRELKRSVQDLSVATGKSTEDLASGLYQVVSAFQDSARTAKYLEISAKAAAAGLSTTRQSIDLLSAVMKGYGDVTIKAARETADLAFYAVKMGQTTFPELAQSMGMVVPMAAALKVDLKELFAAYATLTGVTGNAAIVTTQLSGIMRGFLTQTTNMKKAIRTLGYESVETMIAELGLVGALRAVISVTGQSAESIKSLYMRARALPAVFALNATQADMFDMKLAGASDTMGLMDEAFKEQTEGINKSGHALKKLGAAFKTLAQNIGDKFVAEMEDHATRTEKAVKRIADAIANIPEDISEKWFKGSYKKPPLLIGFVYEKIKPPEEVKSIGEWLKKGRIAEQKEKPYMMIESYGIYLKMAAKIRQHKALELFNLKGMQEAAKIYDEYIVKEKELLELSEAKAKTEEARLKRLDREAAFKEYLLELEKHLSDTYTAAKREELTGKYKITELFGKNAIVNAAKIKHNIENIKMEWQEIPPLVTVTTSAMEDFSNSANKAADIVADFAYSFMHALSMGEDFFSGLLDAVKRFAAGAIAEFIRMKAFAWFLDYFSGGTVKQGAGGAIIGVGVGANWNVGNLTVESMQLPVGELEIAPIQIEGEGLGDIDIQPPIIEVNVEAMKPPNIEVLVESIQPPDVDVYVEAIKSPDIEVYMDDMKLPDIEIYNEAMQPSDIEIYTEAMQPPNIEVYIEAIKSPDIEVYTEVLESPKNEIYMEALQPPNVEIYTEAMKAPNIEIFAEALEIPDIEISIAPIQVEYEKPKIVEMKQPNINIDTITVQPIIKPIVQPVIQQMIQPAERQVMPLMAQPANIEIKTSAMQNMDKGFNAWDMKGDNGRTIININDYRTNAEPEVQVKQNTINGEQIIDVIIESKMKQKIGSGALDGIMNKTYGLNRLGRVG